MSKLSSKGIKEAIQQQFTQVATHYSTSRVHAGGADLEKMLEVANLHQNMLILDAGCGAGHTAIAFAPHVEQVIAYDFTPAMLEQVESLVQDRNITNVTTHEGDVEHLPFDDNLIDLIVSRYSAHHWEHPEQALGEFARVLKPEGQLILTDVVAPENYAQDSFLQTLEVLRDPAHVRDYSISQWLRMLKEAGFQTEVVLATDIQLHFPKWVERMATPPLNQQMLLALFASASDGIRERFQLTNAPGGTFVIPIAVMNAHLQ